MLEDVIRKHNVVKRLRSSVLGPDLEELTAVLTRLGYKESTVQSHLRAAGHLAYWLCRANIPLRSFSEATIRRFIEQHLPRCRCPVPRGKASQIAGIAPHLLQVLRARHRIPPPYVRKPTPIDSILNAFTTHLMMHHGAAVGTCERYSREVRQLLDRVCGRGRLDLSRLTVPALRAFVSERAESCSPRTGRRAATALRSFLRFLHLEGLSAGSLVHAVPAVRDTRRSVLPKALVSSQLQQLLSAVDLSKPAGLRDYAMLLCLAHLGLRAMEVSEMLLDDIDWRRGTLTIPISKARRGAVLPLPARVGRAIATYLRRSRPRTLDRHMFVRHLFPVGAQLKSADVVRAVQRAFQRAKIDAPSRGAHTLRHTAATTMIRAGASLKAVADVLRHRSLDTTVIYTQVDLPRLRDVALPWPEAQR